MKVINEITVTHLLLNYDFVPGCVLSPFPILPHLILTPIHWLGIPLPRRGGEWNPQRVWLPLVPTGNKGRMKIDFGLLTRMYDKIHFIWNHMYKFYIILFWLLTHLVKSLLFISNTDRHYNKSLLTLWVYESSLKDPIAGAEEYWAIFSEGFK